MFKGLITSVIIIIFILVGPAYTMALLNKDYKRQCKTSIILPCIEVI